MNSKEKICPFCKGIFSFSEIKAHIGIEHLGLQSEDFIEEKQASPASQFRCEVCSTQFISEISLERHVLFSHSKVEKCSAKTIGNEEDIIAKSTPKRLGIGNPEHKKNNRKGRLNCPKCSKTFTEGHNLRSHIRIIHERIRLNCPKCEKSFAHKRNLRLHMRTAHDGIKPSLLDCPKCSKTFTQKQCLRTHLRAVHDGIKLDCPKCEKSFTQSHNLHSHMRVVHEGIKLDCPKCEKSFTQRHNLQSHMRIIHEGIKLDCPKCEKSFAHKRHLQSHVRLVH